MSQNQEPTRVPTTRRSTLKPRSSLGPTPDPPRLGGASTLMTVLILVVVGSIVGSCYLTYRMVGSIADMPGRVLGGVREALEAGDPTYSTLPAVIEQLKPLSRLQTEEYFLSTVVQITKPRWIGGLSEEKLVLIACGSVTAGVDLSKISEGDVQSVGAKVIINLPPAELFGTALDEESGCTQVFEHSHPILTEPSKELQGEARQEAIKNFEQTALENGILEKAHRRAQEEIARLLLLTGYETIEFSDTGDKILVPQE